MIQFYILIIISNNKILNLKYKSAFFFICMNIVRVIKKSLSNNFLINYQSGITKKILL